MTHAPARLAALAAAPIPAGPLSPDASFAAAQSLLATLERGQRVDAPLLRAAMESAFGGSDAEGAWDWKMAYDACEAATVLFLRKFGPAMQARAGSPAALLAMLTKIAGSFAHPYAPLGRESGAAAILDADRARAGRPRRRRHHACRSLSWSLRPEPGCSPSSPSLPAGRSFSTNWPRPAPACSIICFPASR